MKIVKLNIYFLMPLCLIMFFFCKSYAQNEKSNSYPNIKKRFAIQPIIGFHKPSFKLGSYGDISKITYIFGARVQTNVSKRFALSLTWLHSTADAIDFEFVGDREKFLEENDQFSNFDGRITTNFITIESHLYFIYKKIKPFISFGMGMYIHSKYPENGSTLNFGSYNKESQSRFGINYGFGIESFILKRASMILAYKHHRAIYFLFDIGKLRTNVIEIGFNFYFK